MKRRRIKCFVAMPFGRKDCDDLYKGQIYPVLKRLNIDPIRVDQRQHKEDLNNYIFRMLNDTDMALADLTYARPSVYFEAGYAENRHNIVVYTARKDHLGRAQSDDRLRVHFDLEMKPITYWQNPSDPSFARRLCKRITFLTKPICQRFKQDGLLERSRASFKAKSVADRIIEIRRAFYRQLESRLFWVDKEGFIGLDTGRMFKPDQLAVGIKLVNRRCYLYVAAIGDSLSTKQLHFVTNKLSGLRLVSSSYKIDSIEEHFFFFTLGSFSHSRFESVFPLASPTHTNGEYLAPATFPLEAHFVEDEGRLKIVNPVSKLYERTLTLISSMDSSLKLKKGIMVHMANLPKQKTNKYTYLITNYGIPSKFYMGKQIQLSDKPPVRNRQERVVSQKPHSFTSQRG